MRFSPGGRRLGSPPTRSHGSTLNRPQRAAAAEQSSSMTRFIKEGAAGRHRYSDATFRLTN